MEGNTNRRLEVQKDRYTSPLKTSGLITKKELQTI